MLFTFFDPNSECFAKYDAFCSDIFDYACLRRKAYRYQKGLNLRKNYVYQKHFLEVAGGRMHAPHPTPLYPPGHKLQKQSKESGIF